VDENKKQCRMKKMKTKPDQEAMKLKRARATGRIIYATAAREELIGDAETAKVLHAAAAMIQNNLHRRRLDENKMPDKLDAMAYETRSWGNPKATAYCLSFSQMLRADLCDQGVDEKTKKKPGPKRFTDLGQ
jgi:hypothetical protein